MKIHTRQTKKGTLDIQISFDPKACPKGKIGDYWR